MKGFIGNEPVYFNQSVEVTVDRYNGGLIAEPKVSKIREEKLAEAIVSNLDSVTFNPNIVAVEIFSILPYNLYANLEQLITCISEAYYRRVK
jgi:hypothetical protein